MNTILRHLHLRSYKNIAFIAAITIPAGALAGDPTFAPSVSAELRYFPQKPAFSGQMSGVQPSYTFTGEGRWMSEDRKKRVRVEPFLRFDGRDGRRTHVDMRELSYSHRFEGFDLLAGNGQIFWGVAESRNVVDVINQFDTVENIDETDKLGQPLIRLGKFYDFGRLEAYYMPYFRERTFPGISGRQRLGLPYENKAEYERSGKEFAGDIALRYTTQFDDFDIGAHAFYGTNRTPYLRVNQDTNTISPIYQKLVQAGVDLQWTQEAWLVKHEMIGAHSGGDDYVAMVTGFEYTFFDVQSSGMDVGILGEYLYDGRDQTKTAQSLFENDIFIGARLTWNDTQDTEFLGGAIIDVETGSVFGSAEFKRRIEENFLLELEGQYLTSSDGDPLDSLSNDSNMTMRFTRYF